MPARGQRGKLALGQRHEHGPAGCEPAHEPLHAPIGHGGAAAGAVVRVVPHVQEDAAAGSRLVGGVVLHHDEQPVRIAVQAQMFGAAPIRFDVTRIEQLPVVVASGVVHAAPSRCAVRVAKLRASRRVAGVAEGRPESEHARDGTAVAFLLYGSALARWCAVSVKSASPCQARAPGNALPGVETAPGRLRAGPFVA